MHDSKSLFEIGIDTSKIDKKSTEMQAVTPRSS